MNTTFFCHCTTASKTNTSTFHARYRYQNINPGVLHGAPTWNVNLPTMITLFNLNLSYIHLDQYHPACHHHLNPFNSAFNSDWKYGSGTYCCHQLPGVPADPNRSSQPSIWYCSFFIISKCIIILASYFHPDQGGAINWLKKQAHDLGLEFHIVEFPKPAEFAVWLTWKGKDSSLKSILLNSHIDVVPVDPVRESLHSKCVLSLLPKCNHFNFSQNGPTSLLEQKRTRKETFMREGLKWVLPGRSLFLFKI